MSLITYEDKVTLNENSQIANINKVTAGDMNQIKNAINNLFPVGFIVSVDNVEFNPNISWGGTWERLKGRFIIGVDENDADISTSGNIGGEKEHTLTINEIPAHKHDVSWNYENGSGSMTGIHGGQRYSGQNFQNSEENGGGQAHNNMPPYYTAYQWIKTAM